MKREIAISQVFVLYNNVASDRISYGNVARNAPYFGKDTNYGRQVTAFPSTDNFHFSRQV